MNSVRATLEIDVEYEFSICELKDMFTSLIYHTRELGLKKNSTLLINFSFATSASCAALRCVALRCVAIVSLLYKEYFFSYDNSFVLISLLQGDVLNGLDAESQVTAPQVLMAISKWQWQHKTRADFPIPRLQSTNHSLFLSSPSRLGIDLVPSRDFQP